MTESPPILALEGLRFAYPGRPALFDGLELELREGARLGLYGPNGQGKTTLLRILTGLEHPSAGRVLFRGAAVTDEKGFQKLRREVGYILQNSDDQLFSATVLEEVAFGPLNLGLSRRAARDRAMETLAELGLEALAERTTRPLSGGEKKLVALASVLSMRPSALLLDEPAASLDEDARTRLRDILRRHPAAAIVVSHEPGFLEQTTTAVVHLVAGRLVPIPPP